MKTSVGWPAIPRVGVASLHAGRSRLKIKRNKKILAIVSITYDNR
jgi:hypothetical protein